ncbi:MAG: hypothetical protein ACI906_005016 [Candidatus Latescibacterota bacterium]|jgi:hypothetical protein
MACSTRMRIVGFHALKAVVSPDHYPGRQSGRTGPIFEQGIVMAGARLRGRQRQNASVFIAGDQIGQGVPFFLPLKWRFCFVGSWGRRIGLSVPSRKRSLAWGNRVNKVSISWILRSGKTALRPKASSNAGSQVCIQRLGRDRCTRCTRFPLPVRSPGQRLLLQRLSEGRQQNVEFGAT